MKTPIASLDDFAALDPFVTRTVASPHSSEVSGEEAASDDKVCSGD